MKIFILYPNQLFKNISNFVDKKVLLIEEPLFFTQYDFHIQKLILHRASMKFYENYLKQKNILVEYFEDESYIELYKDEEIFVYELFDNYLEKKVYKNFELGVNYNHANFDFDQAKDPSFIAGFNTPRHRVKASLSNESLFKNFGFAVNGRWTDEYLWQSSFADGTIPATTVFDAQVTYKIPVIKSVLKLSASNIGGGDYLQVVGAGRIGQVYLASLTINP